MLIQFSIKNWMSFRDLTYISAVATREKQHKESLSWLAKYEMHILPTLAIYGGNASGKSNIVKALSFAKDFVVEGSSPDSEVNVEPFVLNSHSKQELSEFNFVILVKDLIYEFSFALTKEKIHRESLAQIVPSGLKKVLYERTNEKFLFNDKNKFFDFIAKGTRTNQLFLTNSVDQNVKDYKGIYDWFRDKLEIITPESHYQRFDRFITKEYPFYDETNKKLSSLDTGIVRLDGENLPKELAPKGVFDKVKNQKMKKGEMVTVESMPSGDEKYLVTKENDDFVIKKMISYHSGEGGKEVKFELNQESDGTRRIIDLLPAFLMCSSKNSDKVYIIDEIDRSLHHLLIKSLLKEYLTACHENRKSQIIFTTHDLLLMDQDLLRRDEMYVTERNVEGVTSAIPFSDYRDIRYDKDIRKSYLQGRLGGIPHILIEQNSDSPNLTLSKPDGE